MNEMINVRVVPLGDGNKRVTLQGLPIHFSFHLDAEHCLKWARMLESAADDLMSWDGTIEEVEWNASET